MGMMEAVEVGNNTWAPLYLQDVLHLDPLKELVVFGTWLQILFTVSRLISGPLIDCLGYFTSLYISNVICALLLIIGFLLGKNGPYAFVFMSFFYAKGAPEYKEHKNAEGAFVPENRAWHEANRTYTFSYGLGALIMGIGILVFLGIFFPKVGLAGDTLAIIMTLGTLSFLVTTPEVWVPDLGSGEFGFPLLSGAGRLVIKDIVILASAVVLLSDSSQRVLKTLKKD